MLTVIWWADKIVNSAPWRHYDHARSIDTIEELTRGREFLHEIDHLPNVMVKMYCTSQVDTKPIVHIVSAYSTESLFPIAIRLVSQTRDHHINRFVEFAQHCLLLTNMGLRELEVSLPDISGLSDLGADVVVQISGDM